MDYHESIRLALAAAAASGLLVVAPSVQAQGLEPCWGVAKAGQNACGNISGTHTCSGNSKKDYDPEDWTFVARGTCKKIGGLHREEAAAKVKARKKAEASAGSPTSVSVGKASSSKQTPVSRSSPAAQSQTPKPSARSASSTASQ